MFGKSLLQSFWKLFYSSSDQGDFLRSCISFGRCASIKRSLFYHLACTIAWVALSKNLGPAAFLPAMQEKKQRFPRREVLNRHGMRNFLGRALSGQCVREKSQQTGAGEAGPCRASVPVWAVRHGANPRLRSGDMGSAEVRWGLKRVHRNWAKMGQWAWKLPTCGSEGGFLGETKDLDGCEVQHLETEVETTLLGVTPLWIKH